MNFARYETGGTLVLHLWPPAQTPTEKARLRKAPFSESVPLTFCRKRGTCSCLQSKKKCHNADGSLTALNSIGGSAIMPGHRALTFLERWMGKRNSIQIIVAHRGHTWRTEKAKILNYVLQYHIQRDTFLPTTTL